MMPYYEDDWVALYHGDCREVLPSLGITADSTALCATSAWGQAIERYSAIRLADRRKRTAYVNRFVKAWRGWRWHGEDYPRPLDWEHGIWQFYSLGLPIVELEDSVTIACSSTRVHPDDAFRYMCGVVWRKIEEMQQGARDLLDAEAVDGA